VDFVGAYKATMRQIVTAATPASSVVSHLNGEKQSEWFSQDVNHVNCVPSRSPAYYIRQIQEDGRQAQTADTAGPNGLLVKVEVSYSNNDGQTSTVYTLYRSEADCSASLPKNQPIPSRYE
jgi:hypothetical protein